MTLFNLAEHRSCHHYAAKADSGWLFIDDSQPRSYKGMTEFHSILFGMKGTAVVTIDDEVCELREREMKFIPSGVSTSILLDSGGFLMVSYFDIIDFICDKILLQQLKEIKEQTSYEPTPMEIRGAMQPMLETLRFYLEDGVQCAYLYELKVKEFFWNLRAYYSREELGAFMYPILGVTRFHGDVVQAFKCNIKVSELAEQVYMSTSAFYKRFKAEFGISPVEWIHQQSKKQILFLIQDNDLSIGEIADMLSFSSLSSFSRYCSTNFGLSPSALRLELQKGTPTEELL